MFFLLLKYKIQDNSNIKKSGNAKNLKKWDPDQFIYYIKNSIKNMLQISQEYSKSG